MSSAQTRMRIRKSGRGKILDDHDSGSPFCYAFGRKFCASHQIESFSYLLCICDSPPEEVSDSVLSISPDRFSRVKERASHRIGKDKTEFERADIHALFEKIVPFPAGREEASLEKVCVFYLVS